MRWWWCSSGGGSGVAAVVSGGGGGVCRAVISVSVAAAADAAVVFVAVAVGVAAPGDVVAHVVSCGYGGIIHEDVARNGIGICSRSDSRGLSSFCVIPASL